VTETAGADSTTAATVNSDASRDGRAGRPVTGDCEGLSATAGPSGTMVPGSSPTLGLEEPGRLGLDRPRRVVAQGGSLVSLGWEESGATIGPSLPPVPESALTHGPEAPPYTKPDRPRRRHIRVRIASGQRD